MAFLTREFFDTIILTIAIIGGALAVVRLYRDFTRPLPPRYRPPVNTEDATQPRQHD